MPGHIGFPAYCAMMAALPGTSAQLASKAGIKTKGAAEVMRRFWSLGLVYPGGIVGNPEQLSGGATKTVWHAGRGIPVSKRVKKIQPRAAHIMFASLVRALEQPRTTKELAQIVGVGLVTMQARVKALRDAGLVHIPEWTRDAQGRAFARYEWGPGANVKKPPPLSSAEKWRRDKRNKARLLETVWRLAA